MKTRLGCLLALAALLDGAQGQVVLASNNESGQPATIGPAGARVVERTRHTKTVEWVSAKTNAVTSAVTLRTNRYTVLGNAISTQDPATGVWMESKPKVQSYPGGIVCQGGAFWAILSTNLCSAVADLELSQSQRLMLSPLALYFYDPDSGQSVLLAQVKDCAAQVVSNRVLYADAFAGSGIEASLTYAYEAGRFSQSVTLLRKPSVSPADFGMSERTRLEVATEILQGPEPTRTLRVLRQETDPAKRAAAVEPDRYDERLAWGAAVMPLGRAFWVGPDGAERAKPGAVVSKRLLEIQDRRVLFESVEWQDIAGELDKLPKLSASASGVRPEPSAARVLPEQQMAQTKPEESFASRWAQVTRQPRMELAALDRQPSMQEAIAGVVIDYELVESIGNFSFYAGTYYLDSQVVLSGTTTFCYWHVIKYAPYPYVAGLLIDGPVEAWEGYPTYFTARDDDEQGETIEDSTGVPSGTYAWPAMELTEGTSAFSTRTLDVRCAGIGVVVDSGVGSIPVGATAFRDSYLGLSLGSGVTVTVGDMYVCNTAVLTDGWGTLSVIGNWSGCAGTGYDGDSLPDWWEFKYFGGLSQTPTGDYDGDGLSNYEEYSAGSDPTSGCMVVAWGNNSDNQCDVPTDLRTAMAVSGGYQQSLALLSNHTVRGWGSDPRTSGVPSALTNVTSIGSGWNHNVALLEDTTVTAWGYDWNAVTNVPTGLANVTAISVGPMHSLARLANGTVVAWGNNDAGQTNVPSGLNNVVAVGAGGSHSLAAKTDGSVVAWGKNTDGQTDVPSGLANVTAVAAGYEHSLALLSNGTVVGWGDNTYGETDVPAGLNNVVAIAAGGNPFAGEDSAYSLALKSDGTVVAWGSAPVATRPTIDKVTAIGGGMDYALAVRVGRLTPAFVEGPVDQAQTSGGTVSFSAGVVSLATTSYQWQHDGVNISGATSTALTLNNVSAADEGSYRLVASNGAGSTTSAEATFTLVTVPVISNQSQPTNLVCLYGNHPVLSATAWAPMQDAGFPISYQWQFNGVNIANATTHTYDFTVNDDSAGTYTLRVSNAAGSTNVSWQLSLTDVINVTNDLLLIYNMNSVGSSNVCAYYLAQRPMVSGANVLGINCPTTETIYPWDMTNTILSSVSAWLTEHPAKRPQYVVLFLDMPSRVNGYSTNGYFGTNVFPSVQYQLHAWCAPHWQPYVTSINMATVADCTNYINKLRDIGTTYSPGTLVISASAGGYGNTNFVLDNVRHGAGYGLTNTYDANYTNYGYVIWNATNGLAQSGVPSNEILYLDGLETLDTNTVPPTPINLAHLTNAVSIAGYASWGFHSSLGNTYATVGPVRVQWSGSSSWYLIETIESYNGRRFSDSGNFLQWFSSDAFGRADYSNTPVGAVTHVDEPFGLVNSPDVYFGLWAAGRNFARCAWDSRNTSYFQAVGDPLIRH